MNYARQDEYSTKVVIFCNVELIVNYNGKFNL